MKSFWILVLLCSAIPALAGGTENATVAAMRKAPCTETANSAPQDSAGDEMAGSGGGKCFEYELQTENVSYIIRPRSAVLLPPGTEVSIKMAKGELLLSTDGFPKPIRCTVRAMFLRSEEPRMWRRPAGCFTRAGEEISCSGEAEHTR